MANFRSGNLIQGAPLGMTQKVVYLTADDTAVDATSISMLSIGSDNTTATARTFTVSPSTLVGHLLTLTFTSGSSTKAQLQDSGAMKLTSDWLPVQYDTLVLVSDGTNWLEVGRGNESGGIPTIPLASAHILVGSSGGLAADVAMSGDVTISNAGATAIGSGKVLLAMLGTGVTPSHVVKFAGKYTTLGGSATEAQTVSGVAATDVVIATLNTKGGTPRTILTAAPTTNTITYVFSGDPSTDHVVSYMVLRAAT